jgi:magnesium transporter
LLGELDPRSTAGLLLRCEAGAREKLIASLPRASADFVQRLLSFSNDSVGSRMDPCAPAVPGSRSVDDAIAVVRKSPGGALYYLYVLDDRQRLVGVLNLRELMPAPGSQQLAEIMVPDPERARASDSIETLIRHPAWRKVHALPVVDEGDRLLGAVRYSTFRSLEAELGLALSGRDPSKTANALAELLWLGASAAFRTAETALVGSRHAHPQEAP